MPFTYDHQITFEKSPSYFQFEKAPKRIFDYNKNVKLCLIIRNPIIRVISHFTHDLDKVGINIRPNNSHQFIGMFKKKILLQNGSVEHQKSDALISPGRYSESLKRWLKYFPMEQILVLNGENFIINPYEEVVKFEKFLNLKPFFQKEHFIYDEKKGFFCFNNDINSKQVECLKGNKGRPHPYISEDVIQKLEEYYEPYNKEFFDLIGEKKFW